MSQPTLEEGELLLSEALRGGQMWSRVLKRGQTLKLVDVEGGASVAALFYNADLLLERYNMPDTLKAQHIARLTAGDVIFSDMGRVLCSVVADTCGWHDTISGHADARWTEKKYGGGSYQKLRNDFHRNTRDNFLTELAKYGMGKRDIVANVNFFVKVAVDADGNLGWSAGNSKAGDSVTLRAGLDTLLVLSNTPHPLDPSASYAPKPVALEIRKPSAAVDDHCRKNCSENERGFTLTERYFL
ncbi:MAG TPA: urea amidolyase associated protein UAAP1 [Polyangiaceae bacterium]|nr:urea amidolyase associated protein UAAP1 [Polyangiaceae bacterium]